MKCKKRKGLDLRRGTAIFLLLFMGWVYAGPAVGAQALAADTVRATVSYTKKIGYEGHATHNYRATVNGEKLIAYCVEPTKTTASKGTYNAEVCTNELVKKVLYYSYGYPGFSEKTSSYLSSVSRKSCYKGTTGNYILFHVLLSYAYDNKSSKSDAFHGMSSTSKKMFKKVIAKIETWPGPPDGGELNLSPSSVTAELNEESGMQETQGISLIADEENSIVVEIPKETILVKTFADGETEEFDSEDYDSVTISGGDSFAFKAPAEKEGTYTSPEMAETESVFQAYVIKKSAKQDLVFAPEVGRTVSFDITWANEGEEPTESAGNEEEPTTENDEPATEPSDEPTTEADEPTTAADEPTTEADEPTTTADEPTTEADEPTTTADEPTTEQDQSRDEPTTESCDEPVIQPAGAEATEPSETETTEPMVKKEVQPAAGSEGKTDDSPMTGDEKHMALAFVLMGAALLGIGCTLVFRKSLL